MRKRETDRNDTDKGGDDPSQNGAGEATPGPEAASFESAFARVLGPPALARLADLCVDRPVVLVAGDQLMGKSTAARLLAAALGGTVGGAGAVVRRMATERCMTVEAMSRALAQQPEIDVRIDYEAASLVARGEVTAFESRLAGHLGLLLRRLGRKHLLTVVLTCDPRERALRYVAREISAEARARIEPRLVVQPDANFRTYLRALGSIDDADARAVAARFVEIADRDAIDVVRMRALYGVDYRDRSVFDMTVDTTVRSAVDVQASLVEAAKARWGRA